MTRLRKPVFRFLFSIFFLGLALPAGAQSLQDDLAKFVETPAVPGYEKAFAGEIRSRVKNLPLQADNLGNLYVTLGRGAPHRLIVTPMDEPGYVVSGITADGYLRVQRLPQVAPHPQFDLLHAAQPAAVYTRKGKRVPGVFAGLSTHLQPSRQNAPRGAHPDEMYIDIGASSPAEVNQAGVALLDPVALDRQLYAMGYGRLTAPSIGDRFGCAALVELLRRVEPAKLHGTLTVAFVAAQWANSRGLDRLTQHVKADEMIYVGRMLPRRATNRQEAAAEPRTLAAPPGSGVLIGTADREAPLASLAQEIKRLAEEKKIPVITDYSTPLPRVSYTQGPVLPQQFVHLGIATAWPSTPAELIDGADLRKLIALLEAYVLPESPRREQEEGGGGGGGGGADSGFGPGGPSATLILEKLVETYGASGHEEAVRKAITALLPPWAKPETDAAGNLVLHFGPARTGARRGSLAPRVAIVAHMDEIGYQVRSIGEDGHLVVQMLGGFISEFFAGHAVLVHTAAGMRPGVAELPLGWDRPDFQWPARPAGQPGAVSLWRVEVGAGNAAEVEQLGIKPGDSITVPKKYRRLFGTRANGRSFDDRVGCTALVAAVWALGPNFNDRDVTFIWSTGEELGLLGALAAAQRLAAEGRSPDYVFAVDTFVSSDSPLESKRFADAPLAKGFVVRAVDNSNITPRELVDRLVGLARTNGVAVQYGVTGGGNDGAAFLRYGSVNVPIGWPLRYSHSSGEVIDTRDLEALARIVAVIARSW